MADDIKTETQAPIEQAGTLHSSESTPPKTSEKTQAPLLDPQADAPKPAVEPEKDEPKKAEPDAEKQTIAEGVNPDDVVPIDHDDVNIRAVQTLLADAKVTEADAFKIFGKAVASGNLADVDQAALVDKLGETKAQLAMAGVQQWHATVYAATKVVQDQVHKAFGGEAGWESAKEFFKGKEADPAVQELKSMLDRGGIQAELAVERMVKMYTSDPNTKTGNLPLNIQNVQTGNGPAQVIANKVEFVKLLSQCRTPEERQTVQRNWLDSKRSRGEL